MSEDAALLRVLSAASRAQAKVVLVGDHRQLGAVGPGGGFESLVARYGAAVHVLDGNVRQRDVADRAALSELRDGDVAKAVASYARRSRIFVAHDRSTVLDAVVSGWAADMADGHQAAMYVWRRVDVAELNRRGREAWRALGRLGGDELVAPGGTPYTVGDRVVTLAPGAGGSVVTSETGTVVSLEAKAMALVVRMDDGDDLRRLEAQEITGDRLAHAYAVTVHRAQGATVARAHALEDGGGRELAYVKMSRAKDRSTVYVVADDIDQAREDLIREWSAERRPAWVIDSGTPATEPAAVEASQRVARPMRDALRRGRLAAERAAIAAVIPPDPSAELRTVEKELARIRRQREDLAAGKGRYADGPLGHAVWELRQGEMNVARLRRDLDRSASSRRGPSTVASGAWRLARRQRAASRAVEALAGPEASRLDGEEGRLTERLSALGTKRVAHRDWVAQHPRPAGGSTISPTRSRSSTNACNARAAYPHEQWASAGPALGLHRLWREISTWASIWARELRSGCPVARCQGSGHPTSPVMRAHTEGEPSVRSDCRRRAIRAPGTTSADSASTSPPSDVMGAPVVSPLAHREPGRARQIVTHGRR